jgi:hypothetical protein
MDLELAQSLYRAYQQAMRDIHNCSTDDWDQLDELDRDGWTAAALEARRQLDRDRVPAKRPHRKGRGK